MKRFAELYDRIDHTTSTNEKVQALVEYLRTAPPADAAWALYFLTGRRLKRHLPTRLMHEWTIELTALPEWLVQEAYATVGDFAEAISLLLDSRVTPMDPADLRRVHTPRVEQQSLFESVHTIEVPLTIDQVTLTEWIEQRVLPLKDVDDHERRVRVLAWWTRLPRRELFLLNKLLTGEFRVGVSHTLVVRAVAQVASLPTPVVEHRLMGDWKPSAAFFQSLIAQDGASDIPSRPYPFCLASPYEGEIETLGDRYDWLAEWKWDGIRVQAIRRAGEVFLWSRGEELITDRFPEVAAMARTLPDGTVLDGELLAVGPDGPRPFAALQQRIGRQLRVSEVAADVPVTFMAYDLLELDAVDIRTAPLHERRRRLISLLGPTAAMQVSEEVAAPSWAALADRRTESRSRQVEGLMLKRWSSPYTPGRRRGDWWKWKIDPFTVDAVLIYAQPGSGRRATLFTDYTFGVWNDGELVPVAKAYSGLSDVEIDELDRWVRRHTTERFGPVSAVEPTHVFELGFERIAPSARHRSGIAVRFPRILRWRRDKTPPEADTLATLRGLIEPTPRA